MPINVTLIKKQQKTYKCVYYILTGIETKMGLIGSQQWSSSGGRTHQSAGFGLAQTHFALV